MEEELDWLFSEVELGQPGPGNNDVKGYYGTLPESQVLLFTMSGPL